MAARVWSSSYSSVHCHTFPTISITPNGLVPLGCASTSLAGPIARPCSVIGAGPSLGSDPLRHGIGDADSEAAFPPRLPPPPPAVGAAPAGRPESCQSQLPHG